MSAKSNRRAKGDKGPAKSSQSLDFVSSLASTGLVNMDLLNGISDDMSLSPTSNTRSIAYFGNNETYRTLLKSLVKKRSVTRLRALENLKGVFETCSSEEAIEMMPSFCFYYEEALYCHSNQVRLEFNYRLREIVKHIRSNIGHFVKHFIIPLQIYMCDVDNSVRNLCSELFSKLIPEERRDAVLNKYASDTLVFADSLKNLDEAFMEQHNVEPDYIVENIERLHITYQNVFAFLIQKHVTFSSESVALYRAAFKSGIKEVVETGHMYTLELIMAVAGRFTWEELFPSASESTKGRKKVQGLISELGYDNNALISMRNSNILAMWAVISVKYPVVYQDVTVDSYTKLLLNRIHKFESGDDIFKHFSFVVRVFTKCLLQPTWEAISHWCGFIYDDLFSSGIRADQESSLFFIYAELVKLLLSYKEAKEDADFMLRFTTFLPSFSVSSSDEVSEPAVQLLVKVVSSVPSTFTTVIPSIIDKLRDVQNRRQKTLVKVVSILYRSPESDKLIEPLRSLLNSVIQDRLSGNIPDVLLLNHVFAQIGELLKECSSLADGVITSLSGCEETYVQRILQEIELHEDDEFYDSRIDVLKNYVALLKDLQGSTPLVEKLMESIKAMDVSPNFRAYLLSLLMELPLPNLDSDISHLIDPSDANYLTQLVDMPNVYGNAELMGKILLHLPECNMEVVLFLLIDPIVSTLTQDQKFYCVKTMFTKFIAMSSDEREELESELDAFISPEFGDAVVSWFVQALQGNDLKPYLPSFSFFLSIIQPYIKPVCVLLESDEYWEKRCFDCNDFPTLLQTIHEVELVLEDKLYLPMVPRLICSVLSQSFDVKLICVSTNTIQFNAAEIVKCFNLFCSFASTASYSSLIRDDVYENALSLCIDLLPVNELRDVIKMDLPEPLGAKYFKKVCRSHSGFEFHDETDITSTYYSHLHFVVASLKDALAREDAQSLVNSLSSLSHLLNRFVGLTAGEQKELTEVTKSIGSLILSVKGASVATALSDACKQENQFIPAVISFTASLLSTFPLNQDMTEVFENEIWVIVNQLSASIAESLLLCIRIFKLMVRIHSLNEYTIPEDIYNSLLLQFSTALHAAVNAYLLQPVEQRHRKFITSLYRDIDTLSYPLDTTQLTEWIERFIQEPLDQTLDMTICLLLFLKSKHNMEKVIQAFEKVAETTDFSDKIQKLMLFVLVVCGEAEVIQANEVIPGNTDTDEDDEYSSKWSENQEFLAKYRNMISLLSDRGVFKAMWLQIVKDVGIIKEQTNNTPPYPILSPCPLLRGDWQKHLSFYTLYRMSCVLPYCVSYCFMNESSNIPRKLITSTIAYVKDFITQKVVDYTCVKFEALVEEYEMDFVSVTTSSLSILLDIATDAASTKFRLGFSGSFPLDCSVVISKELVLTPLLNNNWDVVYRKRLMDYLSVIKGVVTFVQSVVKSLSQYDPCPICYSIIQPVTKVLPNFDCPQCSGRFHKDCLYTWFLQSNNHCCPLCRCPM